MVKALTYSQVFDYMLFQYNEETMKPLLDEDGKQLLRDEYYIDGINCDPWFFDK